MKVCGAQSHQPFASCLFLLSSFHGSRKYKLKWKLNKSEITGNNFYYTLIHDFWRKDIDKDGMIAGSRKFDSQPGHT